MLNKNRLKNTNNENQTYNLVTFFSFKVGAQI